MANPAHARLLRCRLPKRGNRSERTKDISACVSSVHNTGSSLLRWFACLRGDVRRAWLETLEIWMLPDQNL